MSDTTSAADRKIPVPSLLLYRAVVALDVLAERLPGGSDGAKSAAGLADSLVACDPSPGHDLRTREELRGSRLAGWMVGRSCLDLSGDATDDLDEARATGGSSR